MCLKRVSLFRAGELAHDMMEAGRNLGGENAAFLRGVHEGVRDTGYVSLLGGLCVPDGITIPCRTEPDTPVQFCNQIWGLAEVAPHCNQCSNWYLQATKNCLSLQDIPL